MKTKCPRCGSDKIILPELQPTHLCLECKCRWTEWQQSEIDRLKRKVEVLEEGLNEILDTKKKYSHIISLKTLKAAEEIK